MSPAADPLPFDPITVTYDLEKLIGSGRDVVRVIADVEARACPDPGGRVWAGYAVHLIDIIAGYEQAIANIATPATNGTDTGDAAARAITPGVNEIRARVLQAIASAGSPHHGLPGLTVRDVERRLTMSHGTASARVNEMAHLGYVVDTGRRAVTTTSPEGRDFTGRVYDITPLGRDVLHQRSTTNHEEQP